MRKQLGVVVLLMLLFAGVGTSAVVTRALAQPTPLSALQQAKRLGPKPTPRWYWRWAAWHLGEGYAKGHPLEVDLRPKRAPHRVPSWAWHRLHFFLLARQRLLAGNGHGSHTTTKRKRTTTSTTSTATTASTTTATTPTTTTTATTTTTGTTTTTPSGGETYDQAIAYTNDPPAFTPSRIVDVNSAASFGNALANLQAGDLVKATSSFTVTGETKISNRLSAPAELDLTGVSFVYSGGSDLPAVWLDNAQNLYVFGGDMSTADTGGSCFLDYGSQHVLWWGFSVHDCGGSGVSVFTVGAAVDHLDLQGTITKVGQHLAWDPHAEKGTGLHGAILWDAGTSYAFTNNRFAFSEHDIPVGACVEAGNPMAATATGNVLYLRCVNETEVSVTQTGGNGVEIWGVSGLGLDVKYLEVDNAEGRAFDVNGLSNLTSGCSDCTVEYGIASNTNQNTALNEPNPSLPWDPRGGVTYQNVQPTS